MSPCRAGFTLSSTLARSAVWTYYARTEVKENEYSSIVAIAEGRAPAPFVERRLTVNVARLIVFAIPQSAWTAVRDHIATYRRLDRTLQDKLPWARSDYPLLIALKGREFYGPRDWAPRHWLVLLKCAFASYHPRVQFDARRGQGTAGAH
jgi:hypothetical protein